MNLLATTLPTPEADITKVYNPASAIPVGSDLAHILTGGGFNIFNLIFFLVGFVFFISLISASLGYIFAEGDAQKLAKVNSQIIGSLIGLTVTLVAFVLVNLILNIFGIGNISPFK